jgi:hypothetical protein
MYILPIYTILLRSRVAILLVDRIEHDGMTYQCAASAVSLVMFNR